VNLRQRTLQMAAILMLAIGFAGALISLQLIYPRFLALEQDQARHNAELVIELLNRELELLSPQSEDWSYWDDTYRFALDRNQEFISSNLDLDTQISLKATFIGIFDARGQRLWSRALDIRTGTPLPLPELNVAQLPAKHPLQSQGDQPRLRSGLLHTGQGPMLVSAAPILASDRSGPSRGTLIFGRLFDLEAVRRIARQARLDVTFTAPGLLAGSTPVTSGDDQRIRNSQFEFSSRPDALLGRTVLYSLDGKPALAMTVGTPRDISARGRSVLKLAAIFLLVAGILTSGLMIALLNREIVLPIQHLTELARRIGDEDDHSTRLQTRRNDEIGALGVEFNDMLDRLADARRRLLDQSYKAGASEMAGGIIRDLRESLGPLREKLDSPLRLLDQAQTSGQQILLHQLGDPNIARPKHAEVLQMLQENASEQASVLSEARAELRLLRRHLEQTQETLNEYARYLDSKTTLAPVSLSALLDHAVRMLNPVQRTALIIDIDDSVARAGNVIAAREVLQQVIYLLVSRSASALLAAPQRQGSLRITAMLESGEDHDRVHLRFDDSRPTPSAAQLEQMFRSDASRETHADGLSLPWAASVVTAMNGQLYASASQPFDGLVVNLLLPKAKD